MSTDPTGPDLKLAWNEPLAVEITVQRGQADRVRRLIESTPVWAGRGS